MSMFRMIALLLMLMSVCTARAEGPSADDFLPPVQAKTEEEAKQAREVKQPAAVKTEKDAVMNQEAVVAATSQDAINTVNAEHEIGCKMIKFGSGFGWVATGAKDYRRMANPVATRIAQRQAYIIAFTMAKGNLAETLDGLNNEAKTVVHDALATLDTQDKSLKAAQTNSSEAIAQSAAMLLRGFLVYDVFDDGKSVFVSIVTTPKTRGQFNRPNLSSITADSISAGVDEVLVEIKKGLVAPVGSRIILCSKTNEIGFVGFGSEVIRDDESAAMRAKLNLNAVKVATARAKDALCGTIIGDTTMKLIHIDGQTRDMMKDFEEVEKDDPCAKPDPFAVKELESRQEEFNQVQRTNELYESVRAGKLPPGVIVKTWTNEEKTFAYAVAVYLPSVTQQAAKDAQAMRDSQIVQPVGKGNTGSGAKSGFIDNDDNSVPRPAGEVKTGPSGKVQNEKDL